MIHHYSRLSRVDKKIRSNIYNETVKYWQKNGISKKNFNKILFIDLMYLEGVFGRIYFKILSKLKYL